MHPDAHHLLGELWTNSDRRRTSAPSVRYGLGTPSSLPAAWQTLLLPGYSSEHPPLASRSG